MRSDSVEQELDAVRQFLARIEGGKGDYRETGWLSEEVLAHLGTAIGELHIVAEELRSQKEELDRTHMAIRSERSHYYNLFNNAPDAYLVTSQDGMILEANAEARRMFRLPGEKIPGSFLTDYVPMGEQRAFKAVIARMKAKKTPHTWETVLLRADDASFPAELTVMAARSAESRPTGLHWMVRDKTELKEAEDALHQRLRMEELIAAIAHRFISTAAGEIAGELRRALGKIGEFTGADRCMITLLSEDAGSIEETYEWCPDRADPIDYYLTGTSVAGFQWLVPMMIKGEQVIVPRLEGLPPGAVAEQKFLKNIGARGVVVTPLVLSGHLIGMFFVFHRRGRKWTETDRSLLETAGDLFVNVIARKRNVDALMESEQKYRTLFDNYLNPIIIAGDDGRLTDANTAAIEFMERGVDDLQERQVRELMPGFDLVASQAPQPSCRRTIETEYTIHGTTKNLLVQVVPLSIRNRTILYGIGQDITARKQAEQLVREQKTFLETILREAADGIVVCDAQGTYIYLNDAARRMAGIAMNADLGSISPSSWGTAYRMDGRPIRREDWTLEKALRGISSVGLEVHLEKPDGGSYDLLISAAPVRSSMHTIIGAVATFRDITDRKRAEKEIREQKIFLEAILAEAADPIVVCDARGSYLFLNQAALRMAGIDPDTDISRISPLTWGTAYDADGRPVRRKQMALERALLGESVVGLESRIVRPDGSVYHILISAAPVRSPAHTIIGAVATFRDITGRKRAEEQLRETTEYLDSLLTHASAPIVVWDPDLRITRFNRAFERITGHTEGEMRGRHVNTLFPPGIGEQSLTLVRRAAAGDRWESVEIPIIHEDGTVRTILWNSANIISPDDRLIATIAQGQDITERKHAEIRVQESEAKLRALFEALPIGISIIDENRNVIRVNPALERILDYTEDELAQKEFIRRTYIRPDGTEFPPEEFPSVRVLVETSTVQDVEIGIVKENGGITWTNVSAQPLPFPDWRVVLTTADITWKKHAEQSLRESEERFRHLASFTQENPSPILEVHDDGLVAFANIAAGLALRRQGLPEDPTIFFPRDMEVILGDLRKGNDTFYYREVPVGDAIFGESIYLSSIHNAIRIYAQDVTAYRRSRQERPV
jgi:PAS domain S-box-containing protein